MIRIIFANLIIITSIQLQAAPQNNPIPPNNQPAQLCRALYRTAEYENHNLDACLGLAETTCRNASYNVAIAIVCSSTCPNSTFTLTESHKCSWNPPGRNGCVRDYIGNELVLPLTSEPGDDLKCKGIAPPGVL